VVRGRKAYGRFGRHGDGRTHAWRLSPPAIALTACLVATMAVAETADQTVIARMGGTDVKLAELQAYVQTLPPETQKELADNPAALSRLVRTYVARLLVLNEATGAGWEKQPAVAAQIERARDAAIVGSYLRSRTEPPQDFPTKADIEKAYEANKARFVVPRQYEIAQIFIALPADADKATQDKAQAKLDDVRKKLRQKGVGFDDVARQSSDDANSAEQGGALGWVSEQAMIPEVRLAVAGLEKGAVSEPIKVTDGWHLIQLKDTKPSAIASLADVRELIVATLRNQRQADNEQAYLAQLVAKSPPAVNELALQRILPAHPPGGAKTN
jgi:Parvulin-like peptidyl-prolyl isomerase